MNHKIESLRKQLVFLTGTALLLLSITTCTTTEQLRKQLVEKALAATVSLEMKDSTGTTLGFGSGFFVKPNQIATNFHVIAGARQGSAKLVGKDTRYQIEGIVATDKENDLAILKVTASGVTPLSLGDSDTVNIGAKVYVAGNPKGLEGTFSDGLISRRESYPKKRLQMTAPISPGSSGGPVLNSRGEVIGISVSVHRALDAQNLNFAIPSNSLKALLAKAGPAKPLSEKGQSISAKTYFLRGTAKLELGLYHEAISDYDKAIRLKSDYADAYIGRGLAKGELKEYFAAIADYDTAIRLNSADALAYYFRGLAKRNLEQYAAAIVDYTQAIRLDPDYALAYIHRGIAKDGLKQYAAAIADYDTAIRLNPDDAEAYYNRGLAKYRLEKYFAAIVDYDTAIHLKPDYARAYNNRGYAKYNLEQYDAAIVDFTQAIRLEPDFAGAYNNRGNAKDGLKQYAAAIVDYDTAIRLDPGEAYAYHGRGRAKALLGRTWEAKQDLRTALRLAEKTGDARLKASIEKLLRLLQ